MLATDRTLLTPESTMTITRALPPVRGPRDAVTQRAPGPARPAPRQLDAEQGQGSAVRS